MNVIVERENKMDVTKLTKTIETRLTKLAEKPKIDPNAKRVEVQYKDFKIFGVPGYFRYQSRSGQSVSADNWPTVDAAKKAIDKKEYKGLAAKDELPQQQKVKQVDDGQNIGSGEKPVHPDAAAYEEHSEKAKLAKRLGGAINEDKWNSAKKASMEAYGKIKWPFVNWHYDNSKLEKPAGDTAKQDVHQTDPARMSKEDFKKEVKKDVKGA